MNILIIGPITGTTDYAYRFGHAEGELMGLYPHAHILNPCSIDLSGLPWEDCMKITLTMLKVCDAVYVLQDFEKSKGAMREYSAAERYHKTIIFQQKDVNAVCQMIDDINAKCRGESHEE